MPNKALATSSKKETKPHVPCGTFSVMACMSDMFATRPMAVVIMTTAYLGSAKAVLHTPERQPSSMVAERHVHDNREMDTESILWHNVREGRGHAEDIGQEILDPGSMNTRKLGLTNSKHSFSARAPNARFPFLHSSQDQAQQCGANDENQGQHRQPS